MAKLAIHATAGDGRAAVFSFGASPVTIGSGSLGDLVLAFPFVSQCHAVIHFDERGAHYVDLGSRNGSVVAGQPAKPNRPVRVGPDTDIVLGPLRLRAVVQPGAFDDEAPENEAYFASEEKATARTSASRETAALPAGFSPEAFLAGLQKHDEAPLRPERLPQRSMTLHMKMVLAQAPPAAPEPPPPPSAPPGYGFTKVLPPRAESAASTEPPLTAAGHTQHVGELRVSSSGNTGSTADRLEGLLGRLEDESDRNLVVALVALAEHAAESFVALRDARKTTGQELGIRVIQESTPIYSTRTATELLTYLLGSPEQATERTRQLTRATSELLIVHELAFLAALREGVSALMETLDPTGPAFKERRRGVFGLREYQAFFAEHDEDPWRLVFGDRFVRSYAAATASQVAEAPPEPSPRPRDQTRLVSAPAPRLVFESGALAGTQVGLLADEELTFGRSEDNAVVLDDPSVSRRHAVIGKRPEGWLIADAGSRNGIKLNDEVVVSAVLSDGDVVSIGDVKARFVHRAPG